MGNVLICQNIPNIESDLEAGYLHKLSENDDSFTYNNPTKLSYEQAYDNGYDRGYQDGYANSKTDNDDYKKQYIDLVNRMDNPDSGSSLVKELIADYSRMFNKYNEYNAEEWNMTNTAALATLRTSMIETVQSVKRLMLSGYTFNKAWLFAYDEDMMHHQFMLDFMQRPAN